jgi:hypothetical protein
MIDKKEIIEKINDLVDNWISESKKLTNKSFSMLKQKNYAIGYYQMAIAYHKCANQLLELLDEDL